jgi:ubiquinone/menaquinone biosynthesis C-methylase UbiE
MPGWHVADLGCGTGYFTISFARAVGKDGVVSAVDIMTEPLESVKGRAEAMGMNNVQSIRADLEVLGGTKIPDNSQDISLLANTMFQSQKKDAMLAEAVRMLKPGGRLVVIEWKKGVPGFGPPDALRTDEEAMRALATAAGVRFERTIEAGSFYFGHIYTK